MTGREEIKNKIEISINKMLEGKPELYSKYVAYCFGEGKQPTTIRAYLRTLIAFMNCIDNPCTEESVKTITALDISNYMNSIRIKKKTKSEISEHTSSTYKATEFSALKNFFEFLVVGRVIDDTPMRRMKRPKVTDPLPQEYMTMDEIKQVVNLAKKGRNITGKAKAKEKIMHSRNVAVLAMLFETGMRCNALASLDVKDVDLKNKVVLYRDKGDKVFEKALSDSLTKILRTWINDRKKMKPKTNALFISEQKTRCAYGTILRISKDYTGEALQKAMTTHKFRHSAITAVYEHSGGNIKLASDFAGHSNISVTNRYVNTDYKEQMKSESEFLATAF